MQITQTLSPIAPPCGVDTRAHLANLERVLGTHACPRARLFPALRLPGSVVPEPAQRASPRRSIAARWRDLHGGSGWSGLVDPLDPDLRRELLRYGDFIHSAYHAFFHASTPELPDGSYRVTRHLYATSPIELPRWLPTSAFPRSSWIGFVAVCDSDSEIRRMGRRDIVIALRGTATWTEWAENLRAHLVHVDGRDGDDSKVACGFRSLYATAGAGIPSLSAAVADEVRRLVARYNGESLSITVTGHSLGAALAVIAGDELSAAESSPPVAVFSYGAPRVGNRAFAERVEGRPGLRVLRVANARDLVTRVPAMVGGGYAHVGRELRVDSKVSPFLKSDAGPACCHDLEAYLHLVDGLGGGEGVEFRPNARRSLGRLLSQQPGNVKEVYGGRDPALLRLPGFS